MKDNSKTRAWQLYELGREYNESLSPSQYNLVETNTEFFIGNQWLRLPDTPAMRGLPKPVFNILKRVASLFIASLTSSAASIRFEPLARYASGTEGDPGGDAARFANAEVEALLEKFKFDYRIRDALFDGATVGDYCAHFYFDPEALPYGGAYGGAGGEIEMELVDGINVMFGNPNDRRVQTQPYILIVGRDTVEHLRDEAERFRRAGGEEARIAADSDFDRMPGAGGRVEIAESDAGTGKALFVYLYTKASREEPVLDDNGEPATEELTDAEGNVLYETDAAGTPVFDDRGLPVPRRRPKTRTVASVHVTKATKTAVIYEDVDTGMSLYPVAWGNWEKQKNQYHGRALVTGLIPNQIFINSMFATAMRHMQLAAFPKTVYNADLISRWDGEIGQAIGIHGLPPGSGIAEAAVNLSPAEMSGQIFTLIDKVMACTKECLGATDAQMGSVRPDNTSALMVLQTNAEVPLENIRANLYEWVEDVGAILLDMMGTYYGRRSAVVERSFEEPVAGPDGRPVIDPLTGTMRTQTVSRRVPEEYDFSRFKHLWLDLRADVGASTYFSEIAMTQTLDNLRRDGTLDVIQYLERLPDKLLPKKQELLEELRSRAGGPAAETAAAPKSANSKARFVQGGALDDEKAIQGLPQLTAAIYERLPDIAKRSARLQGARRAGG